MTTQSEIIHRIKNIAQVMMCLQHEFDKLIKEVNGGVVNNTDSDCVGDVGWSVSESAKEIWNPDSQFNCGLEKEKVEGNGFITLRDYS